MEKHTLGPWTGKTQVSDCGCSIDINARGAIMIPYRLNYCSTHAAAPALLEALERQLRTGSAASDYADACNQSLAAIRKAKGE
jgi:hypothetical protein